MVPTEQENSVGGSERAKTPETHLDIQTITPIDPRSHFSSDAAYDSWRATRDRQVAKDPKLVGDTVSGIAAYLPADTD